MSKDKKLRFAVAGCGYIGKRHIKNLLQHPCCELAALIDTDRNKLEELSYLGISSFISVEHFFASDNRIDAMIIATPNGAHTSLALQALEYNMHVLIEKPLALTKKDAETILQVAEQKEKKLMVVLQNRFSPISKWLKQLAEENTLGQVYMVQINCFWNRDERYYTKESWHGTKTLDGGTLFTQFSHFIDMLYWLFGGIENMESRFYNFRHQHLTSFEDSGFITFDFITGGCGSLQFTTASWDKNLESSMTVIAQNGSVKVSGQYMDTIEYCHIKNYTLPRLQASSQNNHYYMLNEMVNAIQHKLPTNASDAAHVVGLIEQMYANVKELHPIN